MTALTEEVRPLATDADHQLAAELAAHSAELRRALRASGIDDPDALRKQGNRRSHELLVTELASRRPGDAVLSEEGKEGPAPARLGARRAQFVDPLDGTREFGGLHASRLDGTPLAYNNPSPYQPDLLIAHPDWAQAALQAVAGGEPSAGTSPAQGR